MNQIICLHEHGSTFRFFLGYWGSIRRHVLIINLSSFYRNNNRRNNLQLDRLHARQKTYTIIMVETVVILHQGKYHNVLRRCVPHALIHTTGWETWMSTSMWQVSKHAVRRLRRVQRLAFQRIPGKIFLSSNGKTSPNIYDTEI